MSSPPTLDERIRAIEQLTRIFRADRTLFLGATLLALLFLLAVAVRLLIEGKGSMAEWGTLFGSSGLITLTINRTLQMWTQALRLLASEPIDTGGTEVQGRD
ncbi:MAG TPA: hypothetical protein VMG82_11725 [Candidatus Sulfotelmatobacter sp.]|nr:hypothetical protein [Candidatus Sulfotelmatobacter sp.]